MKVGDYIRTNDGKIGKIGNITRYAQTDNYCMIMCENFEDYENNIIKSSPNIIDLIEVGDIVNYEQLNGGVVLNKKEDSIDTWSILPNSLKNEDIKSVITKEQLKNCMYEVGD